MYPKCPEPKIKSVQSPGLLCLETREEQTSLPGVHQGAIATVEDFVWQKLTKLKISNDLFELSDPSSLQCSWRSLQACARAIILVVAGLHAKGLVHLASRLPNKSSCWEASTDVSMSDKAPVKGSFTWILILLYLPGCFTCAYIDTLCIRACIVSRIYQYITFLLVVAATSAWRASFLRIWSPRTWWCSMVGWNSLMWMVAYPLTVRWAGWPLRFEELFFDKTMGCSWLEVSGWHPIS